MESILLFFSSFKFALSLSLILHSPFSSAQIMQGTFLSSSFNSLIVFSQHQTFSALPLLFTLQRTPCFSSCCSSLFSATAFFGLLTFLLFIFFFIAFKKFHVFLVYAMNPMEQNKFICHPVLDR